MTPAFTVLHIYQGQTFADVLQVTPARDLTTEEARMQIRAYRTGPVIMTLSTTNGRITLDAAGHVTFHVTAADTAAIETAADWEQWVYDLELYHEVGLEEVVQRAFTGVVIFWPEVTTG